MNFGELCLFVVQGVTHLPQLSSGIKCDNFYNLLIKIYNEIKLNKRNKVVIIFLITDFNGLGGKGKLLKRICR